MDKDTKIVGNEQDVKAQMRRQIRTFCYYLDRVSFKIEQLVRKGMSHADACSFVENWINSDEENFGSGCVITNGPKPKTEHIRFWFPELSEEEALEEAKIDDEFRRRTEPSPSEKRRMMLDAFRGVNMMLAMERHKNRPRIRSAYRREPGRVFSRSRRTSRAAVAASSSSSGDSGGSEPPQSDPDLPSFRFVRSGTLRSYLKTDRFLSSWRLGCPGLMAHVRRCAA